jgi:hypothetical protein
MENDNFFLFAAKGTGNFGLFSANGKRKTTVFFLGRQTINGNQHFIFQQTCTCMYGYIKDNHHTATFGM